MSPEQIATIAAKARDGGDPAALRERLRTQFPGLHFTCCSEDDIPARARPVHDESGFALYLVGAGGGHCLSLTDDADHASGVVVASKSAD